jgi:hypothetical protein
MQQIIYTGGLVIRVDIISISKIVLVGLVLSDSINLPIVA